MGLWLMSLEGPLCAMLCPGDYVICPLLCDTGATGTFARMWPSLDLKPALCDPKALFLA